MKTRIFLPLMLASFLVVPVAARAQTYTFSIFAGQTNSPGTNDGAPLFSQFNHPHGLAVDPQDNLYVADTGNGSVRFVARTGLTSTLTNLMELTILTDFTLPPLPTNPPPPLIEPAGIILGPLPVPIPTPFSFTAPLGVAVDAGTNLYVSDSNTIYKMPIVFSSHFFTATPGYVTVLAGSTAGLTNGTGTNAAFNQPYGLTLDAATNLYVADEGNDAVREITLAGVTTTFYQFLFGFPELVTMEPGPPPDFVFPSLTGVAVGVSNDVYAAVSQVGIYCITQSNVASHFWNTLNPTNSDGIAIDKPGNVYIVTAPSNTVLKISPAGVVTTLGNLPTQGHIGGVAVDSYQNLFFADTDDDVIIKGTAPVPAPFFNGQKNQFLDLYFGNGVYYLQFTNAPFGLYTVNSFNFPIFYHFDLGFEYFYDANDGANGAYFYDYSAATVWYTSPEIFPYLYDFFLDSWLYYYPDPNRPGNYTRNPRYFYNFNTGQIITR